MASDITSRPARTVLQLGVAGVLVEVVDSTIWDMTDRQYAAILALLTVIVTWLQVVIENRTNKGLLRNYDSVQGTVVDTKPTPGGQV